MIVIDTCVVSELTRPTPSPSVVRWLRAHRGEGVFLSVITVGELVRGVELLDAGRRRAGLERWLDGLRGTYADRILPVSEAVAVRWGQLSARCRSQGRPLASLDGLIAATALEARFGIATRNVADFEQTGVAVVNPWDAG